RREAVRALAGQWQGELIAPLRALRRRWKAAAAEDTAIAGLRQRLAQLEVDAERELLARLEALCAPWPARETRPARAWLAALASPDSEATALARLAAAAGAWNGIRRGAWPWRAPCAPGSCAQPWRRRGAPGRAAWPAARGRRWPGPRRRRPCRHAAGPDAGTPGC